MKIDISKKEITSTLTMIAALKPWGPMTIQADEGRTTATAYGIHGTLTITIAAQVTSPGAVSLPAAE